MTDLKLDMEILELVEKYDISCEQARERYNRKQKQLELAVERNKAQNNKKENSNKNTSPNDIPTYYNDY